MKRTLALVVVAVIGLSVVSAALPVGGVDGGPELAQAQKPGGGGGNKAERSGENLAELISDIVGPVLIVLVGVIGLLAFAQRSMAMVVTALIVGLVTGLFILQPESAESVFQSVYRTIF